MLDKILEVSGLGGIGAFIIALIGVLGLKAKTDNLDEKKLDKEIFTDTCNKIQSDIGYVRDRVDKIYDHLLNGKRVV